MAKRHKTEIRRINEAGRPEWGIVSGGILLLNMTDEFQSRLFERKRYV